MQRPSPGQIILITGIMASGKSSVAQALDRHAEACWSRDVPVSE
ncbi:MAG: hypothetical protein WKF81_13170 [Thermomicrobiales bacterium]